MNHLGLFFETIKEETTKLYSIKKYENNKSSVEILSKYNIETELSFLKYLYDGSTGIKTTNEFKLKNKKNLEHGIIESGLIYILPKISKSQLKNNNPSLTIYPQGFLKLESYYEFGYDGIALTTKNFKEIDLLYIREENQDIWEEIQNQDKIGNLIRKIIQNLPLENYISFPTNAEEHFLR